MGGISPVLEAYLGGLQGQTKINENARGYALQKQHLDALVDQFKQEMEHKNKQLALEQQVHDLTRQHDIAEYTKALPELLQSAPELAGTLPTNVPTPVPTFARANVGTDNMGLPNTMSVPGMNVRNTVQNLPPLPGTPISMPSPYGGTINLNMPKSKTQELAEQAQAVQSATMPGEIARFKATIGDENTKKLESALAIANNKNDIQAMIHQNQIDMLNKYHSDTISQKDRETSMRETIAAMGERSRMQLELLKLGFISPDDTNESASKYTALASTGHLSPEIEKMMTPAERLVFKKQMTTLGYQQPTAKDISDLNTAAIKGVETLNNTASYLANNPAPKTAAGKAANYAANAVGLNREYKNYKATTLANMETTLGMPLGRINGSPALLQQFEPMLVQSFESPKVADEKQDRMADVFMGRLAQTLNKYLPEQRKMLLREVMTNNPGIEQNGYLSSKFHQFLDKGTYSPKVSIPQ